MSALASFVLAVVPLLLLALIAGVSCTGKKRSATARKSIHTYEFQS
jgi:hypothetical protein